MTGSFLNILKWLCTLTEKLLIWTVRRQNWQYICGRSSVLKSSRSSICLHLKRKDKGRHLENLLTAQKTEECIRQATCRKTERICSWEEEEGGFYFYCLPTLCLKNSTILWKDSWWLLDTLSYEFFKHLGSLAFTVRCMLSQVTLSPCTLKQELESSGWCMWFIPWDSEEL